jgi:hypothetical protein
LNFAPLELADALHHTEVVPNRSSKRGQGPKDFNQIAWEVVQKAIGEMPKEEPPDPSKNPAAVTLGRLGGLKGGKARAESLSPAKRKAIAKKAAEARWKKA